QAVLPIAIAVLFPSWSLSIEAVYYAFAPLLKRMNMIAPTVLVVVSFGFCCLRPYISQLYVGSDTYGLSIGAMWWAWLAGWLAYATPEKVWAYALCVSVGCVSVWIDPLLLGFFNYACWTLVLTLL